MFTYDWVENNMTGDVNQICGHPVIILSYSAMAYFIVLFNSVIETHIAWLQDTMENQKGLVNGTSLLMLVDRMMMDNRQGRGGSMRSWRNYKWKKIFENVQKGREGDYWRAPERQNRSLTKDNDSLVNKRPQRGRQKNSAKKCGTC